MEKATTNLCNREHDLSSSYKRVVEARTDIDISSGEFIKDEFHGYALSVNNYISHQKTWVI